jgi:hypothetical protein
MIRMRARSLGVRLRHVFTILRRTVVLRPRAVVHLRWTIHPNHPRPATSRRRSGSSRRLRHRWYRLHRRRSDRRSRTSHRRRIPSLNSLVPTTRARLAHFRRIRSVLANTRSTRRRSGRHLRYRHLRYQKPRCHCHHANDRLHALSLLQLDSQSVGRNNA